MCWLGWTDLQHGTALGAAACFVCAALTFAYMVYVLYRQRTTPAPKTFQVVYEIPDARLRPEDLGTWSIGLWLLCEVYFPKWHGITPLLLVAPLVLLYDGLETAYGARRVYILMLVAFGVAIDSLMRSHALAVPVVPSVLGLSAAGFVSFAWPESRSLANLTWAVLRALFGICFTYALQPFSWTLEGTIGVCVGVAAAFAVGRPKPAVTVIDRLKASAPEGVLFFCGERNRNVYFTGPVETALDLGLASPYELARRQFEPNSIAASVDDLKDTGVGLRCYVRNPDALLSKLTAH